MTFDAKARAVLTKAVGTVESGMRWNAINYNDPITVGLMQWYGTRAAHILQRIKNEKPSAWQGVAASLQSSLNSHPWSSTYWTGRYLTRAEGSSLSGPLTNASDIQADQASKDWDDYVGIAQRNGLDANANTQTFMLFCVAYHQSPRRALSVLRSVGVNATMNRYLSGLLSEPVLGKYRSRYNQAATIISNNDSSGVPTSGEDTAVGGDASSAGGLGGTNALNEASTLAAQSQIRSVQRLPGGGLKVIAANGTTIAQPATPGMWIGSAGGSAHSAGAAAAGTPEGGGITPGAPGSGGSAAMQLKRAIVQWAASRENKFKVYTNGPARSDPDRTGATDCSGMVRRAYLDVAKMDLGGYTVPQAANGNGIFVIPWTTGKMTAQHIAMIEPADLVFHDWGAGSAWNSRPGVDHVELAVGDGADYTWGMGSAPGPHKNSLTGFANKAYAWCVKRYINA